MSKQRLLFAEDDPLVSAMMVPVLAELEFDVVSVSRGDEALQLLLEQQFSIVISDLKMPGAAGLEVLERARELDPGVRLIAISGYADEAMRDEVTKLGGKLLHKPFGVQQLRRVIAEELEAR